MINNKLDQTDYRILDLLQQDAWISHKAIAHAVNKSATAVNVRIKKLNEEGFIKCYKAIVDKKKIGRNLTGFVKVNLEKHTEVSLSSFMTEVIKLEEVMECYHITGDFDFLLRISINDMEEYSNVLMKKIANLPGIENFTSHFVIAEVKHETGFKFNGKGGG
jgi:Lrp/AsnC family leucine-responsive transcriptional regulator